METSWVMLPLLATHATTVFSPAIDNVAVPTKSLSLFSQETQFSLRILCNRGRQNLFSRSAFEI